MFPLKLSSKAVKGPNQHIIMISEGSTDIEDWSNDAEKEIHYILKWRNGKQIFYSAQYCCIFEQIISKNTRHFFSKTNLSDPKHLNNSVILRNLHCLICHKKNVFSGALGIELKHLCLEYMTPWLRNLVRFCKHNDDAKRQRVTAILDKLITMTINEKQMYPSIQAKIWGSLGQVVPSNPHKTLLHNT